jgi:hypothetical protein
MTYWDEMLETIEARHRKLMLDKLDAEAARVLGAAGVFRPVARDGRIVNITNDWVDPKPVVACPACHVPGSLVSYVRNDDCVLCRGSGSVEELL